MFASAAQWREGRKRLKRDAVTRLLRGLDAAMARQVAKAVERELNDVGLGGVAAEFAR